MMKPQENSRSVSWLLRLYKLMCSFPAFVFFFSGVYSGPQPKRKAGSIGGGFVQYKFNWAKHQELKLCGYVPP